MPKKEMNMMSGDNTFGLAGVVLGIVAIVVAFSQPFGGLALGIVAIVFSSKQSRAGRNKWSKAGKILGWVAIVLSVIGLILGIVYLTKMVQDPNFAANLAGGL